MTTLGEIRARRQQGETHHDDFDWLLGEVERLQDERDQAVKLVDEVKSHATAQCQYSMERAERAERERDAARDALRRLLKIINEGGSWRDGVSPLTSMWEITAEEDRELDAALDQAGDALTPSESTP
jgi:hypothetical protein